MTFRKYLLYPYGLWMHLSFELSRAQDLAGPVQGWEAPGPGGGQGNTMEMPLGSKNAQPQVLRLPPALDSGVAVRGLGGLQPSVPLQQSYAWG